MWIKTVTVVLTWVLLCGCFLTLVSACKEDWFGPNCQYKCHCIPSCDPDGSCRGGAKCDGGWFGPACQYVDMASRRGKKTINSVTDNNGKAIPQLIVSFKTPLPFTWMKIDFKDPDPVPHFQLQFKPHDTDVVMDCKNQRNVTVNKISMDIYCDLDVAFKEVILKGEGIKSVSSIYISGGRNVALRQKTNQSSTFPGLWSYRGVDGNYFTCAHTADEDKKPVWSVIITVPQLIKRYLVHQRREKSKSLFPPEAMEKLYLRMRAFLLKSFSQNGTIVFNHKDKSTAPPSYFELLHPDVKRPVSVVSIEAFHKIEGEIILTVAEVELFGDSGCPNGKYGRECEHTCHCDRKDETCFVSTGGCPSGCGSGFIGDDCQTECPLKYHGKDCKEKCNTNCVDELCYATTGKCKECKPGIYGDHCQSECLPKYFGKRCKEKCNPSCAEGLCDAVTGLCKDCSPGWMGKKCEFACPGTMFGKNCEKNCNPLCLNHLCDSATGVCLDCVPGKMGNNCQSDCPVDKFGSGCSETCSNGCTRRSSTDRVCDSSDGTCVYECKAGYLGRQCNETCPETTYGDGCYNYCSTSCVNETCNSTTGVCLECRPGMMGDDCHSECLDRFGSGCEFPCPSKCKNSVDNKRVCDSVYGTCSQGCKDGYLGPVCNEICPVGNYGPNCLKNCSVHCSESSSNSNSTGTSVCHHELGLCLHGCVEGFEGDLCQAPIKDAFAGANMRLYLGLFVILLTALILCIALYPAVSNDTDDDQADA